jgi:N-methylhydantoinase B
MKADPIKLEIFKSLYSSVAEEMGVSLRRSAFSPNIKERRDYSCAVFNREGVLIAQGDHMPVHLGSMPMSVRAALDTLQLQPGDIAVLNDPYAGGTHLPDVTMVAGVFDEGKRQNMACDALTRAAAKTKRQKLGQAMWFANADSG